MVAQLLSLPLRVLKDDEREDSGKCKEINGVRKKCVNLYDKTNQFLKTKRMRACAKKLALFCASFLSLLIAGIKNVL